VHPGLPAALTHNRGATREVAVTKRRQNTPRTPEKEQQDVDNWIPGSGASPDPRISFPQTVERTLSPDERPFSKIASDKIREEIAHQEKKLADLRRAFPRVNTATLSELSPAEEQGANRMEARQKTIDLLELEIHSRGENATMFRIHAESKRTTEGNRSEPQTLAKSADPKSPVTSDRNAFSHSPDYRSVVFRGEKLLFTSRQAQVVEMLHKAFLSGAAELGKDHILEALGSKNSRLRDTFRKHPAWNFLIVRGKLRGTYRLNLSESTR
jgi:hypothetical protein